MNKANAQLQILFVVPSKDLILYSSLKKKCGNKPYDFSFCFLFVPTPQFDKCGHIYWQLEHNMVYYFAFSGTRPSRLHRLHLPTCNNFHENGLSNTQR